jgi:hypothetical protein
MPANSLIKLAATKPDYEDRQGHQSVSIVPSRRNSRVLKPYELPDILREVKKCHTLRGDGEHAWAPTPNGDHLVLTAGTVIFRNLPYPSARSRTSDAYQNSYRVSPGVSINGYKYREGTVISYFPYVKPRNNQAGAGGIDGVVTSRKIGRVVHFIQFQLPETDLLNGYTSLVAVIRDIPIKSTSEWDDQLYSVLPSEESPEDLFIDVDSIAGKAMLVPHYDKQMQEDNYSNVIVYRRMR